MKVLSAFLFVLSLSAFVLFSGFSRSPEVFSGLDLANQTQKIVSSISDEIEIVKSEVVSGSAKTVGVDSSLYRGVSQGSGIPFSEQDLLLKVNQSSLENLKISSKGADQPAHHINTKEPYAVDRKDQAQSLIKSLKSIEAN